MGTFIQIQLLLKLNQTTTFPMLSLVNSNTTLVKVKYFSQKKNRSKIKYSNTTLVKVKYGLKRKGVILINSNTTLVKVKFYI